MAAQSSPVTPALVRWAVEEDGRQLGTLAEKLDVDEDTLLAWSTGDARPTRGQLTALAELLQRPRALFFLPRPPVAAALPASFRHPPGAQSDVSVTARRRVRQARRVQQAVSWVLRAEEAEPVSLPAYGLTVDPEQAGADARTWSAVSSQQQAQWANAREASTAWREALDARGVLVFMIEVGRDDVRGFSSWDSHAPLVAANVSSVAPAARSFTLAHELAHLASRSDAACVEPDDLVVDADVERWCEQFAAAYLMPRLDVLRLLAGVAQGGASMDEVRTVMTRFRVSARAAALRLIDLGYARPALYNEVKSVFRPAPPPTTPRKGSPSRAELRLRTYGPRALSLILQGVSPYDALGLLRLTVEDARQLAQKVPGADAQL